MKNLDEFINQFVNNFVDHHGDMYLNDVKHNGMTFKEYMKLDYSFKDSLMSEINSNLITLLPLTDIEYESYSPRLEEEVYEKVKKKAYRGVKREFLENISSEIERIEENFIEYNYNEKDKDKFVKQLDILKKELVELQ